MIFIASLSDILSMQDKTENEHRFFLQSSSETLQICKVFCCHYGTIGYVKSEKR